MRASLLAVAKSIYYRYMNVLQHTRNELNLCLKQNRRDRSYRDTLFSDVFAAFASLDLKIPRDPFRL